MGDILFEADPIRLAKIITGTGHSTWLEENSTLYTEEGEARRDAEARMKRQKKEAMTPLDKLSRSLQDASIAQRVASRWTLSAKAGAAREHLLEQAQHQAEHFKAEALKEARGDDEAKMGALKKVHDEVLKEIDRLEHEVKSVKPASEDAKKYEEEFHKRSEYFKAGLKKDVADLSHSAQFFETVITNMTRYPNLLLGGHLGSPKGHDEFWAGAKIKLAMEHSSPEELKKYLHDHPGADPKNHTVKKTEEKGGGGEGEKKPKSETFKPTRYHKELGSNLSQWQGGKGSKAIDEVASHLIAEKPVPRAKLMDAAKELEALLPAAKQGLHGWGKKEVKELNGMISHLKNLHDNVD
jgi:hypothetical protein